MLEAWCDLCDRPRPPEAYADAALHFGGLARRSEHMADLEEEGYLTHPHTSAGRVPTDLAYRFFVDRVVRPEALTTSERARIEQEVLAGESTLERILMNATRALGILVHELGVGSVPQLDNAQLQKSTSFRFRRTRPHGGDDPVGMVRTA